MCVCVYVCVCVCVCVCVEGGINSGLCLNITTCVMNLNFFLFVLDVTDVKWHYDPKGILFTNKVK